MLVRKLRQLALITAAFFSLPSFAAQSAFIAPSESLGFGITVPEDNDADLYFTLAMPVGQQWAAVGLGSDKMAGALVLMIYSSSADKNVTFSPRLAKGHSEPEFYAGLQYETLPGTGFVNNTYVYSAVCHNCRKWPGGSVDVTSTSQKCIYAAGPGGFVNSNNQKESVKYHSEFGHLTVDMKHATGAAGAPSLNGDISTDGITVGKWSGGKRDYVAIMHAVIMVGCFVGLMPLGILILRLGEWVRWHGVNQLIAFIGVIIGFGLGIAISLRYVRAKKFNTAHQIIGLIVFLFLIAQFLLGFFHHRIYKRTQQPTKLAPVHVWLGRLTIVLGISNGFLGFPLALSPTYNWILMGLVLAVVPICFFMLFWKRFFRKRRERQRAEEMANPQGGGYVHEPWRNAPAQGVYAGNQGAYGAGYGETGISLTDMRGNDMSSTAKEARSSTRDLGRQQTPREYV